MTQNETLTTTVISTPSGQSEKDETYNNSSTKTAVVHHKVKRRILIFGLGLSTVCAVFPSMALAPAVGLIAQDMNDYENMSWYMSVFFLGSAILQLLSVKISDFFGRRRVYLFGIFLMMISSVIAGLSVNSYMLIVFRAFNGIGCGIIQTVFILFNWVMHGVNFIAILVDDLFPIEKRITYLSVNSIAFGVSSSVGPLLGGIISDKLSWRYSLGLNAVLTIPTFAIIYFYVQIPIRPEQRLSRANFKTFLSRIDAGGCIIVSAGIVSFLLAMNLGSTSLKYDWSSPLVIGLLAGSFALLITLTIYERFVSSLPLFPSLLVTNRNLILIYTQQFINAFYYIVIIEGAVIIFQSVYNETPTTSSIKIIPAIVTFIIFTIIQARITKKVKTPKPTMIVGNSIVMLSLLLLTFIRTEKSSTGIQIGLLVLYAAGFGCVNQGTNIGSQLILEQTAPHMLAASSALIRFILQMGLAVIIAIFFSVMNSQVEANVESLQQTDPSLYQRIIESGSYRNYVDIVSIKDKQAQATLNSIYMKSILNVYYGLIAVCAIAILCTLLVKIPKMPERKSKETGSIDS